MSEELKPCPFCDKEPAPYWNGVGCVTSGCVLNGLHLDADKWNRRAKPAEAEGVEPVAWIMNERLERLANGWSSTVYSPAWADRHLAEVPSQALILQSDHLAALSAVTAERDAARRECDENEGAMQVWRRRTAQAEAERDRLLAEVERCAQIAAENAADSARLYAEVEALLAFVTDCTETAGGVVNGNKLSNRAKEVIAAMAAKGA